MAESQVHRGRKNYRGTPGGILDDRRRLEVGNYIYELGAHPGILTRICTESQKKNDFIQSLGYDTLENGRIPNHTKVHTSNAAAGATEILVENSNIFHSEMIAFNVNTTCLLYTSPSPRDS